jgi:hypothetical protein
MYIPTRRQRGLEIVGYWPTIELAVRGAASSAVVAGYLEVLTVAAGLGKPDGSSLNRLEGRISDRRPFLIQMLDALPAISPADRTARLADKIATELVAVQHAPNNESGPVGNATGHESMGKARRLACMEAARQENFVETVVDALKAHRGGDWKGATRIMFCSISERRPDASPNKLAKKIMYGKVSPHDLGSEHTWLVELISKVPQYLAHEMAAQWVRDGHGTADDFNSVKLEELWDVIKGPGREWGEKLDVIGMILVPLLQATHGGYITKQPAAERHRDALLNTYVPVMVGTLFEAIGEKWKGQHSVRGVMQQSLRFVNVHAGYEVQTEQVTMPLVQAQAELWAGVFSEAGANMDEQRFGEDFKGEASRVNLEDETSSPARAKWMQARNAFTAAAVRRKHSIGSTAVAQPVVGVAVMAAALAGLTITAQSRTAQARSQIKDRYKDTEEEAALAAAKQSGKLAAHAAFDQAKLAEAKKVGTKVVGANYVFNDVKYAKANVDEQLDGVCGVWTINKIAGQVQAADCGDTNCKLKHDRITSGFHLSSSRVYDASTWARAEYPPKRQRAKSPGGKGSGKGEGKGKGKGKGRGGK